MAILNKILSKKINTILNKILSSDSITPIGPWILATGFWDDAGSWDDTASWID
jgi:hypothetical protein